jgi:hypothetical protein
MCPYCRIYQKQYTCPTLVLGQAKTMAKNSFRNRKFQADQMEDSYKDNVHIMGRN